MPTCGSEKFTFRQVGGLQRALLAPNRRGSITLQAPLAPALQSQLKAWQDSYQGADCVLSQDSATGRFLPAWMLHQALPAKLTVYSANAGGQSVQTILLNIGFASIAKT